MHKTAAILVGLAGLTTTAKPALADFTPEDAAVLDTDVHDLAPLPGLEKAPARAPAWCAHVKPDSGYHASGVAQELDARPLFAAKILCTFPKNNKSVQRAAAILEQGWINSTGESDADAVMSLTARLDEPAFRAAKQKLCSQLTVSSEVSGEDALFMKTRGHVLGCDNNDHAAWEDDEPIYPDSLAAYLDQSANPPDELVKLGYSLDKVKIAFSKMNDNPNRFASAYGLASYDAHDLAKANLDKLLESAPYKDNVYARVVFAESYARTKMGIAILDAKATKLAASDPDWKEFLYEAPKRGAKQWIDAAKTHPDEIARSNQFEHTHDSGSRKRSEGCAKVLIPDFEKVFGALDHTTFEAATASLADPVASLLFQRLVTCLDDTHDPGAKALAEVRDRSVRYSRGPRTAILAAEAETLAKIHDDRPKFPAAIDSLLFDAVRVGDRGAGGSPETHGPKGTIQSATTKGGIVHVVFSKKSTKYMARECVDTKHVIQVRDNGSVQYEQRCRDLGMKSEDATPEPIDVPVAYAHGVVPGAYIETNGDGFPTAVYTDSKKKKLVNFNGFTL
ncbi:MAG TPA: hypothetical protein VIV58_08865 [Kofleriaceae bacterium]